MSRMFKQPFVETGMIVNWHADFSATAPPSPAVVTAVGDQAIMVAIIDSHHTSLNPKFGVRHKDDPQLQKIFQGDNDSGCWAHTPMTERLMKAFPELYPVPEPPKPPASSAKTHEKAAA